MKRHTHQRWLSALAALAALLWLPSVAGWPVAASSPAAVLTQHNDNGRTGANLNETILTTHNVNVSEFGKLFARTVDGQIYAQPLYVPTLLIHNAFHNVVFVATMHNSVYAFDADDPAASAPLWQVSLGASAPITYTLPNDTVGHDFGPDDYRDIATEVGILSTPVIDRNSQTLYVLAFNREPTPATCPCRYAHRLHALNLLDGTDKHAPAVIAGAVPGSGADSVNGTVTFSSTTQLQRAGLLLADGVIYIGFASYGDEPPFHGWLFGYSAASLARVSVFNDSPETGRSGIWQSGQGPAVDAGGHVYVVTGDGLYDPAHGEYGDSVLRLDPQSVSGGLLPVHDHFTPMEQAQLDLNDTDLGSAGPLVIPGTNLLLAGGKSGKLYLLNENDLGGYQEGPGSSDRVVQSLQATNTITNSGHIHGTPVIWNGPNGPRLYIWGEGEAIKEFRLTIHTTVSATIQTTPVATGSTKLQNWYMPGGFLAVSANGSAAGSGIVWASHPITNANLATVKGILRAYDAADVSHELWNSTQNAARDGVGKFAKFNPPTVANGKVYLATFSNQLLVYGLFNPPEPQPWPRWFIPLLLR